MGKRGAHFSKEEEKCTKNIGKEVKQRREMKVAQGEVSQAPRERKGKWFSTWKETKKLLG